MTTLRHLLARLTLRERVLVTAFLWVMVILWSHFAFRHFGATRREFTTLGHRLAEHQIWLDGSDQIENDLTVARGRLDPTRTFSSIQLVGQVDALARRLDGLSFSISSPTTEASEIFQVHSVRVELRRASLTEVARYLQAVHQESPYLGLERLQLSAYRPDPRQVDAVLEIGSFELSDDAL